MDFISSALSWTTELLREDVYTTIWGNQAWSDDLGRIPGVPCNESAVEFRKFIYELLFNWRVLEPILGVQFCQTYLDCHFQLLDSYFGSEIFRKMLFGCELSAREVNEVLRLDMAIREIIVLLRSLSAEKTQRHTERERWKYIDQRVVKQSYAVSELIPRLELVLARTAEQYTNVVDKLV